MDPFPQFEACSFNFQTDNLESLHSYQLALLPFKQDFNWYKCHQARTIFLQRRQRALETNEEGIPEAMSELKRLQRIQEVLGVAQRKSKMDSCVGTEETVYSREEMRSLEEENARLKQDLDSLKCSLDGTKASVLPRNAEAGPSKQITSTKNGASVNSSRSSSTYAPPNGKSGLSDPSPRREFGPELLGPPLYWNPHTQSLEPVQSRSPSRRRQSSLASPSRTPSIPRQSTPLPVPSRRSPPPNPSPPGPFFSIIHHNTFEMIPDDLRSRLFIVFVRNLPLGITPLLLLHFLRRPQRQRVPRPVAIAVTNAGNVMIAFTSEDSARIAAQCLDGKGLPGFVGQRKMQAQQWKPNEPYRFKWCQLSDEMRDAWNSGRQMPRGEWVSNSAPPSRGSVVSDEYEQERRCILDWQRDRAIQDQRQREEFEEEQRRYQEQMRYEERMRYEEQMRFEEEEQRRQSFSYQDSWDSYGSGEEESYNDSDDCEREFKRQRFY